MANRVERLDLDVGKENVIEEAIIIQQGENISLTLEVSVLAYGEAFEVTENTEAYFLCARPDGTNVMANAVIETRNPTFLTFDVPDAVAKVSGEIALAYFLLSDSTTGWKATTDYFAITVTRGIDADDITGSDDYLTLIDLIEQAERQIADNSAEWDVLVETVNTSVGTANTAANAADVATAAAKKAAAGADEAAGKADTAAAKADTAASNANTKADAANTAANAADVATAAAKTATTAALEAAEEARGAVAPEMALYMTYDSIGGTDYLTLVDTEEE